MELSGRFICLIVQKMKNINVSDKKRTDVKGKERFGADIVIPFLVLSFINQPTPTIVSLLYKYMKRLKIKVFPG